jgi:hypothetical protein
MKEIAYKLKCGCLSAAFMLEEKSKDEIIDFFVYFITEYSIYIRNRLILLTNIMKKLDVEDWKKIVSQIGEESVYSYELLSFIYLHCFIDKAFLKNIGFNEVELNAKLKSKLEIKKNKEFIKKYNQILIDYCVRNNISKNMAIDTYNLFSKRKNKSPPKYILDKLE